MTRMERLLLLVPIGVLAAGDFRRRKVGVVWLGVFAATALGVTLWSNGWRETVMNVAFNVLLLLYLAVGILVYLRIRRGKWMNPLKEYVGSGDLIFLAGAAPLFDLRGYLLFLIGASVFSLVWMAVARATGGAARTIPFVAMTGIVLAITIILQVCLEGRV